jgi:hypothetical protein
VCFGFWLCLLPLAVLCPCPMVQKRGDKQTNSDKLYKSQTFHYGKQRVSGGLGMYEGATGSMNWQCWSNCTIALDVCVLDAVQQN